MVTLSGETRVTEVALHCPEHREQAFRPTGSLAPRGSTYGYDVLAEIGRLRYREHKQAVEIGEELGRRGVRVPTRTVSWLCQRFLTFAFAVHVESMPLISSFIKRRGGYVLHIDGTGNRGAVVLLMKEGWSMFNLLAAHAESEKTAHVAPLLRFLKEHLGPPVAAVSDDSKGLLSSLREVFPGTYVVLCHFHFLREVGIKLFEPLYPRFKCRVDRRGVKGRLKSLRRTLLSVPRENGEATLALEMVDYILAYKEEGEGLAYPFSLPAVSFYRRCKEIRGEARMAILDRAGRNACSPYLSRLEDVLRLLEPPPNVLGRLYADFLSLEERWRWFQRVRRALRYRNGPVPLSTQVRLSERELEKGRRRLDWVSRKIGEPVERGGGGKEGRELRRALGRVRSYIEKHRDSLLAPNVSVMAGGKSVVRKVPRTNVPVESDFRLLRRHGRRITGSGDVESRVQREGAGMLIAQNLTDPRYVSLVYGSRSSLADRFSTVSPAAMQLAKSFMGSSHDDYEGRNRLLPQ